MSEAFPGGTLSPEFSSINRAIKTSLPSGSPNWSFSRNILSIAGLAVSTQLRKHFLSRNYVKVLGMEGDPEMNGTVLAHSEDTPVRGEVCKQFSCGARRDEVGPRMGLK